MRTVRFGVIGLGLTGREFASAVARWCHLSDTGAKPEIVAVCDLNPNNIAWFAAHFPSIRLATRDYRELLALREVEAGYCAVPHNLHEPFYTDILKAGCVTPAEVAYSHRLFTAALKSQAAGTTESV